MQMGNSCQNDWRENPSQDNCVFKGAPGNFFPFHLHWDKD